MQDWGDGRGRRESWGAGDRQKWEGRPRCQRGGGGKGEERSGEGEGDRAGEEAGREGGREKLDDRNVENHREAFNWRQKFRKG